MDSPVTACLAHLLHGNGPSPCFVLDEPQLRANAAVLQKVQERTGARILLALKAFSAWSVFDLLSRAKGGPLWGTCASSVDEARLGFEAFGGEVHAFAAAWTEDEIRELLPIADHIVFNSHAQWRQLGPLVQAHNAGHPAKAISCGLRINPEHSEGITPMYDPCAPGSRLGIRPRHFRPEELAGISGLHFHTLCEQDSVALARTLEAVERGFGPHLARCQWINMGGGHHITRPGYDIDLLCELLVRWRDTCQTQIYLEPGEAVALNAGWLTATVLDVVEADMPVALLDVSAACHMPDVLEMPYTPEVFCLGPDGAIGKAQGAGQGAWSCRLAGKSCLAGDVIGEYGFAAPLVPGQRLVFGDMAIYSMVKTTTFNGLRLPAIGLCHERAGAMDFRLIREFGYQDFKTRLS